MHITFVKKILSSGELCKKCREVSERLESEDLIDSINHIAIADDRDPQSEGVRLAKQYGVTRAPFFLVEVDGETTAFDIYFKFKKFMLEHGIGAASTSSL
ncbi:MAG: hypothetical protein JKX81_13010 [Arenicella sp.]|nr:hypothetical protein [Arenicella sp.]